MDKINECRLPTCTNEQHEGLSICLECMINTVRRFLFAEGTTPEIDYFTPNEFQKQRSIYWWNYVIENIDDLVARETTVVLTYGADYDRNSDTPHLRPAFDGDKDE